MIQDRTYVIHKGKFLPSASFCGFDDRGVPWVCYGEGGKEYPARRQDLVLLTPARHVDCVHDVIAVDGRVDPSVTDAAICRDPRYILVETSGGWIDAFLEGRVRFIRREDDPYAIRVLNYLFSMAGLKELDIPGDDDGSTISLADKYRRMLVRKDSLLSSYLSGRTPLPSSIIGGKPVIFPFGCNRSQHLAVRNAMEYPLSTIQGPPGTGKTQTILNIIANLILRDKTVEVVSNNNSAVSNVGEKLEKAGLGFIVAALGNSGNKKAFIEGQTGSIPDYVPGWLLPQQQRLKLSAATERIEKRLEAMFRMDIELHETLTALNDIRFQREDFERSNPPPPHRRRLPLFLSSDRILREKARLAVGRPRAPVVEKVAGIMRTVAGLPGGENAETLLDGLYYAVKESELERVRRRDERRLRLFGFSTALDRLRDQSMLLLKDAVARKYIGSRRSAALRRDVFTQDDIRNASSAFLIQYPVVLSTTFSSASNVNAGAPFDCVIMDESSQVDIAAGALALSVADRAVIVGDLKQLPNVVTRKDHEKSAAIAAAFRIQDIYDVTRHSFLESVMGTLRVPGVTLREHYRCHPLIIEFCNRAFYDGELVVMTKGEFTDDAMELLTTVKGNHQRGKHNVRQVEEIEANIGRWRGEGEHSSIGIIAPYNEQIERLAMALPGEEVATVHKFQGREKDVIVFSTVNNEPNEFTDDPHLLNVAVSRAMRKFVLVAPEGTPSDGNIKALEEFIRYYRGGETKGKVRSVFDLLYEGYTEERLRFLREHGEISDELSENLCYGVIKDALARRGEQDRYNIVNQYPLRYVVDLDGDGFTDEEKEYGRRSGTHLDFLLFTRLGRRPVLAIEVDGVAFHKADSVQGKRDRLKDAIMAKAGIPLLRASTDAAGLEEKIDSWLEGC